MADNFSITTASGSVSLAADDISSTYYQRVKMVQGTDGSADADVGKFSAVTDTNALPVQMYHATDFVSSGGAALAVSRQWTQLTTTTQAAIIAAGTGVLRILSMIIAFHDNGDDLAIRDGNGGTVLITLGDDNATLTSTARSIVLPFNPVGWFQTSSATALWGVPGTTTAVDVHCVYVDLG